MSIYNKEDELDFGAKEVKTKRYTLGLDYDLDEYFDSLQATTDPDAEPWDSDPVCSKAFALIKEGFEYGIRLLPGTNKFSCLVKWSEDADMLTSAEGVWSAYVKNSERLGIEPDPSSVRSLALVTGSPSDNTIIIELDDPKWMDEFRSAIRNHLHMDLNECAAYKSRNKKLPHVCLRIEDDFDMNALKEAVSEISGKRLVLPSFAHYKTEEGTSEGISLRGTGQLAFCYAWDNDGNDLIRHNPDLSVIDPPAIDFQTQFIPLIAELSELDERTDNSCEIAIAERNYDKDPKEREILNHLNSDPGSLLEICDKHEHLDSAVKVVTKHRTFWNYKRIGSNNSLAVRVLGPSSDKPSVMFIYSSDSSLDDLREFCAGSSANSSNLFAMPSAVIKIREYAGDYRRMLSVEGKKIGIDIDEELSEMVTVAKETKPDTAFSCERIDMRDIYEMSPEPVKKIARILSNLNPLVGDFTHLITAQTLAGSVIGKRAKGMNMGREYTPSIWIAALIPTGGNKSGIASLKRAFQDFVHDPQVSTDVYNLEPNFTTAALFHDCGNVIPWKSFKDKDEEEKEAIKQAFRQSQSNFRARLMISDELTYAITSNLGTGAAGKINQKELQTILKLADNDSGIEDITQQHGCRIIYRPSISIIGYAQYASWKDKFDSNEFRDAGFLGRFLPVVNNEFAPLGFKSKDRHQEDLISELTEVMKEMHSSIKGHTSITFAQGTTKDRDFISNIIRELLAEDKYIASFKKFMSSEWDTYLSKAIVAAIRLSLMHGSLDPSVVTDERIDKKLFKKYLKESLVCFGSYLLSMGSLSEEQKLLEKITRYLMKRNGKVDIYAIRRLGYKQNGRGLGVKEVRYLLSELSNLGIANVYFKGDGKYVADIQEASWTGKELVWSKEQ